MGIYLEGAEGEVGVGMQAEDLGRLLGGQLLDALPEGGNLREVRHVIAREELVALLQRLRVEVLLRVRVHHQLVHGVRDAPAVLDLRVCANAFKRANTHSWSGTGRRVRKGEGSPRCWCTRAVVGTGGPVKRNNNIRNPRYCLRASYRRGGPVKSLKRTYIREEPLE
eukprot:168152-Prorocentrum_minimum.AAC.5